MRSQNPQSHEAEVEALGGRVMRAIPAGVTRGRILQRVDIPDNSTTAADLTAAAQVRDRKILDAAGTSAAANDPAVIMVVERIGVSFAEGAETPAIILDLLEELEFVHSGVGFTPRTLQAADFYSGSPFSIVGTATTDGEVYALKGKHEIPTFFVPHAPLEIDLQSDTWTLGTRAAVNTGATVECLVWLDVILRRKEQGWMRRQPQACGSDRSLDLAGEYDRAEHSKRLFRVGSI